MKAESSSPMSRTGMSSHLSTACLPLLSTSSPIRVAFGPGRLAELGALAAAQGAQRVLLVTDPGIVAAGHVARAVESCAAARLHVTVFDGVSENPTTDHVAAGVAVAKKANIDFLIALGGGSSMDCAKGINLILTNGGAIADYRGENKATAPMLPLIAAPTTAGTGSEAQSFALISDPITHEKFVCGDRRLPTKGGLRPRIAILDPDLMRTVPRRVAAAAGIDAVAHAVETAGTKARNAASLDCSREAWTRLDGQLERWLRDPRDDNARAEMLMAAHLAGLAIELSMLGAAHAGANPLTARCGITHGFAVGVMLPHVVRFNAAGDNPYGALDENPHRLAERIEQFLATANIPPRLRDHGVREADLPALAESAAKQWTAGFNPRPVDARELLTIYQAAW